jgi:hypothetical protein
MKQYYAAAKMKVIVKPLMDYVHYNSSTPVKLLEDVKIRNRIKAIEWTSYHSSLSSTCGLIDKMMADFRGPNADALWGALSPDAAVWYTNIKDEVNRFNPQAHSNPPPDLVAFTAIYLEATGGYPPNKWWQGEAAVAKVGESFKLKARLVAEMMVQNQTKLIQMSGDTSLAIKSMSTDVSSSAQDVVLNNAATLSIRDLEAGIKEAATKDNAELFKAEFEKRKNTGKAKV